jgi:hypothetical protein
MNIDKILERFGLKYEDLNAVEKETLNNWLNALSQNNLTIEKIREYIKAMKESVERELTKTDHNTKQDIFLKARLRNYILLEDLLSSPERAKKSIEAMLEVAKNRPL